MKKKYEFPVLIEKDEDGYYVGTVHSLKGCHTQAKTLAELEKRIREVILLCLEDERNIPHNTFVGVHRLEIIR